MKANFYFLIVNIFSSPVGLLGVNAGSFVSAEVQWDSERGFLASSPSNSDFLLTRVKEHKRRREGEFQLFKSSIKWGIICPLLSLLPSDTVLGQHQHRQKVMSCLLNAEKYKYC